MPPEVCSGWANVRKTPMLANGGHQNQADLTDNHTNSPFPAYYDSYRKTYWIQNARGGWIEVNETGLRRHLKARGYSCERGPAFVSPLDGTINEIQVEKDVAYAGALAGYKQGILEAYGNRILVTTAPKLIEPREGNFPTISALIRNLLYDPNRDQQPFVFGWLKVAIESLQSGQHRPGQALAIAGPRDSGKSLFQNMVTGILGGRAAKPYRYMSGATEFNGELFGCEHLMIEDDIGSTDFRARRNFGTRIKEFTVNEVQSCHAKNRQAINLKPFWRLSITLNEEPENLLILPPLDESLQDKIILLKAQKKPMPMPTITREGRSQFWKTLISELPAFIWFLTRWEIPPELRSERFGVTHYHHPELLAELETMAPENKLLEIIDMYFHISGRDSEKWQGTAAELESQLLNSQDVGAESRKLLNWPNATGTYLGRLMRKHPDRIEFDRSADRRGWIIKPKPSK